MLTNKTVGFIGGGAIAEAMVCGIIKARLVPSGQITVNDISETRLQHLEQTYNIHTSTDSRAVASGVDILFLTVKPQVITGVLELIAPVIAPSTTVISVVAGMTLATLQQKITASPLVRVMPNTPVAVGEGMAAIALGNLADKSTEQMVSVIFSAVGKAITVNESSMDAVTALSGSGPGYAFVLLDALTDAGVLVGLSRQQATVLAAQTLLGAAKMVLETGEHPAKLRDMVTSPAGTTIEGIYVLEQRGVRAAIIDAVVAAAERSREMGKKP